MRKCKKRCRKICEKELIELIEMSSLNMVVSTRSTTTLFCSILQLLELYIYTVVIKYGIIILLEMPDFQGGVSQNSIGTAEI